jgi:hypothetical protein
MHTRASLGTEEIPPAGGGYALRADTGLWLASLHLGVCVHGCSVCARHEGRGESDDGGDLEHHVDGWSGELGCGLKEDLIVLIAEPGYVGIGEDKKTIRGEHEPALIRKQLPRSVTLEVIATLSMSCGAFVYITSC